MGLLYIFPCSEEEKDRIEFSKANVPSITLKSYGLPRIFWIYMLCILSFIFLMEIAIQDALIKLFQTGDSLNKGLVILVILTLILIPISLLIFFLYEKRISKIKNKLTVGHYLLGLKLKSKSYNLSPSDSFFITHFRGSPNIAREKNDPQLRAFENQGYFELFGVMENGDNFFLDRNNRKADLVKITNLLNSF